MTYDELLKQFAEKLGGGIELQPDEAGAIVLDIDEMQMTILGLEEVGQVVLSGVVGEPPPEDRMERLYKAMLEANHNFVGTFGATLSINPENGNVSLCRMLPLALADGDSFFAAVEQFVNTLETWKKLVADFRGAEVSAGFDRAGGGSSSVEAAPRDVSESEMPFGGFGGVGGFMQV